MAATIAFEKWHGLGNDFVLVEEEGDDARARWARWAPLCCDRHEGVGADGVLLVSSAKRSMHVINADGSVPEMCGNGLRCVAGWLAERASAAHMEASIATGAGSLATEAVAEGPGRWRVRTRIAVPHFGGLETGAERVAADGLGEGVVVSMGNPHWVFFDAPGVDVLRERGPHLEHDARFPQRTNVEFVTALGPARYRVDVWERGCGLTRACGTGAAAVAASLYASGAVSPECAVTLELPGGALVATRDAAGGIWLTGPAVNVFRGLWSAPAV